MTAAGEPAALFRTTLDEQLLREATAMASYALASGKPLPPTVVQIVRDSLVASSATDDPRIAPYDITALTWAHAQLTGIVAPAVPRAVQLLAEQADRRGRWSIFGPVRLVRYLLVLSLVSLVGLVLVGSTEEVTATSGNIFTQSGVPALLNGLFFLCAASVGAAFSGLFRINLYIATTTYDPKHDASYWVQYGLGLIAGVLLATVIPVNDASAGAAVGRPVLALVGGFSASLLYRILDRLTRSIESMLGAPLDSAASTRGGEQPGVAGDADGLAWQRIELMGALSEIQRQLSVGETSDDQLKRSLSNLVAVLAQTDALTSNHQPLPPPTQAPLVRTAKRPRSAVDPGS